MVSALQQQTANSKSDITRIFLMIETLQKACATYSVFQAKTEERLGNVEHTTQIGKNTIDIGNLTYSVKKSDRVLADQSHDLESLKVNLSRVGEITTMANTAMRSRMDELEKALKQQDIEKKNEAKIEAKKAYDAAVKGEAQAKTNYKAAWGKSP